jgi:hypothetical protein
VESVICAGALNIAHGIIWNWNLFHFCSLKNVFFLKTFKLKFKWTNLWDLQTKKWSRQRKSKVWETF